MCTGMSHLSVQQEAVEELKAGVGGGGGGVVGGAGGGGGKGCIYSRKRRRMGDMVIDRNEEFTRKQKMD